MSALVEAIKFLCFTMKSHEENPVGSLLIEHLKVIRVYSIISQKIATTLLPAKDLPMTWKVISKEVSAIIIIRGSIVSWLIMTPHIEKIMLGIHPGMMFLLIRRSCATRTIIPRCLYLTGIEVKNDILLEGELRIFFEM